ncbi:EF-P 5-aminopentanol modification-associated protein YfmF [Thermoactinomyces sp. DSM 45892]|uniref:EF-P 5-aminopentanol modification-associated protein YfmF n=1 Tax=Thermoactinomyces sp. DSM 45892 TaxID=1882753 RepID=UPI0008956687|nr:pitrilysin family protein [Thermoactinomyces sp. DSM 45892]SDY37504.1 Predicted Zn-dependent peptidase [Thermoactinomyces sp. DSM 45892]
MENNINMITQEVGDIHLHLWKTDKFKTTSIMLKINSPLSEETVTARALIPEILQSGTMDYPNRTMIKQKLDDMYGAVLMTDIQKNGDHHVITFRIDVVSERYLSSKVSLLQEALLLLHQIVMDPCLENDNDTFVKGIVEQEKRVLQQRIQSIYDNKMVYSSVRMTEELFAEDVYRLPEYGRIEDLDVLDSKAIYQVYKQMLQHDRMDLFIVGSFNEDSIKEIVSSLFGNERSVREPQTVHTWNKNVIREKVVFDQKEVKQGHLLMGYRTYATSIEDNYVATRVANCLLGGSPSSKLFTNVREKNSLAYFVGSKLEPYKGALIVVAGIEFDRYDQTVDIIRKQIVAIKKGDFTESDMEQAKALLINQLWSNIDTSLGLIELAYPEIIENRPLSLQDRIKKIRNVTKEDVIRSVNRWELDTIYFLTSGGE